MNDQKQLNRWRLILGSQSKDQISFGGEGFRAMESGIGCEDLEEALDFLYSREYGEDVRREGGTGASRLTTAGWITKYHQDPPSVSQGDGGGIGAPCLGALRDAGAFNG